MYVQYMKEYFTLRTSSATYYAEIWHQYPTMDKVYVGGRRKCVAFSVYLDEPMPNLDALGFHEDCVTEGEMAHGRGTRHLLKTALAFLHLRYQTRHVLLRDASTIACNGYEMPLAQYSLLHHQKTWYQKHFRAVPSSAPRHRRFQEDLATWKNMLGTKPMPLFHKVQGKARKQQLDTWYVPCDNLKDFFAFLKDKDCIVYKDWVSDLMIDVFPYLSDLEWRIDLERLRLPHITVQSLPVKPPQMFVGGSRIGVFSAPP